MAALDGITVVDLSEGLAGALCTLQLAEAGARVIAVEPLEGGEPRRLGRPVGQESGLARQLLRDKQSVALDLGAEAARPLLQALLGAADVIVTDCQPTRAAALGLSRAEIAAAARPEAVHCSLTPYGDDGPYADRPATELELQGVANCQWFVGRLGEPPVRVGSDMVTAAGAMQAFLAIVAALVERGESGRGQHVAVSLLGSMLSFNSHWMADFSEPDDFGGGLTAPYDGPEIGYATGDRPMAIGLYGRRADRQAHFLDLCRAIGLEALLEDEWMAKHGAGLLGVGTDAQGLKPILEDVFAGMTSQQVLETLLANGGAGAPMLEYDDLFGDPPHPQVEALGALTEVARPGGGSYRAIQSPWATDPDVGRAGHVGAPALGADTERVLTELGIAPATLATLQAAGALRCAAPDGGR